MSTCEDDRNYEDRREPGENLASQVNELFEQQLEEWPDLAEAYEQLARVHVRTLGFDGFDVKLQYNPGRILSSSASVDPKSIRERKCFLCRRHLPELQKVVPYGDYLVLVNPYPVFSEHFTITHRDHIPQHIGGVFEAMLDLSAAMGTHYTLLYNGPRAGASAPDHLHFQAGERGAMPADADREEMIGRFGTWIVFNDRVRMARVDDGLRQYLAWESADKSELVKRFMHFHDVFLRVSSDNLTESGYICGESGFCGPGEPDKYNESGQARIVGEPREAQKFTESSQAHKFNEPGTTHKCNETDETREFSEPIEPNRVNESVEPDNSGEPMMNILVTREKTSWHVIVFLRKKHRPKAYFLKDDKKILFSPSSVDLGGLCILPLERDFQRLTADQLASMFQEVSAGPAVLDAVARQL